MKEEDLNKIIKITIIVAMILWLSVIIYLKLDLLSFDSIKPLGGIISFLTFFWAIFFHWGWKWPILKHLFNRPDVNGTWIGSFETDWQDKKGQKALLGEIAITIKQTFLFIHVTSFTNRYIAYSYAETLLLDKNRDIQRIVYLYSQNRVNPGAKGDRQGTAELTILGQNTKYLSGDFWTDAKTNGFIKVKQISNKRISSFEEAKEKWPDNKDWQIIKKHRS